MIRRLVEWLLAVIGGERWEPTIDLRERLDGQTSDWSHVGGQDDAPRESDG